MTLQPLYKVTAHKLTSFGWKSQGIALCLAIPPLNNQILYYFCVLAAFVRKTPESRFRTASVSIVSKTSWDHLLVQDPSRPPVVISDRRVSIRRPAAPEDSEERIYTPPPRGGGSTEAF